MKLNQMAANNPQHALVHGMPKSGKSTLVAQLAEAGYHLYWISIDNGHSILTKLSAEAQNNIDIIVLPDTRDFPIAAVTCKQLFKLQACKICDSHGQINCAACTKNAGATWTEWDFKKLGPKDVVVVDHISGLAESVINNICKDDFKKNEYYKFEWDDYRAQGSSMHSFLTTVQFAPFNCICIAHSLEVTAEDGTKLLVPQVGTRAFSDTVGKYFDHIIYSHIMNNSHRFGSGTLYRPGVLTGSRSDIAIEKMDAKKDVLLLTCMTTSNKGQYIENAEVAQKILSTASVAVSKEVPATAAVDVKKVEEVKTEVVEKKEEEAPAPVAQVAKVTATQTPTLSLAERIKQRLAEMPKKEH